MLTILILALCVGTVSVTVSAQRVFRPFRHWLRGKNDWLYGLVSCPYCLSHWLTLVVMITLYPTVTDYWAPWNYLISFFLIVALAHIYIAVFVFISGIGQE